MRFVYVMSESDKDIMLSLGYTLLKQNGSIMWVFKNNDEFTFADEDKIAQAGVRYILSDVLTF